mmetsp:Transcript_120230/g.209325  ORF Transcript_120230/g.209325 Transcript_120230/m.209325 type:complete len:113 (-) Transcript_120230:7970-8308(-)
MWPRAAMITHRARAIPIMDMLMSVMSVRIPLSFRFSCATSRTFGAGVIPFHLQFHSLHFVACELMTWAQSLANLQFAICQSLFHKWFYNLLNLCIKIRVAEDRSTATLSVFC